MLLISTFYALVWIHVKFRASLNFFYWQESSRYSCFLSVLKYFMPCWLFLEVCFVKKNKFFYVHIRLLEESCETFTLRSKQQLVNVWYPGTLIIKFNTLVINFNFLNLENDHWYDWKYFWSVNLRTFDV